jgi:preprotein translocase subunit SecF
MRIFQNANYPFMERRQRAYVLTAIAILIGLAAMVNNYVRHGSWLNYGIDFTGGTQAQVDLGRPADVGEVRQALEAAGGSSWEVSSFGKSSEYVIRIPAREFSSDIGSSPGDRVRNALKGGFPQVQVLSTDAVSAKVGDELQLRALLAIVLSLTATLVYLWYRFEWRFGLAAIAATAHDIVITLGILAVLRSDISLGTIAAFLTIVGYSLNDTIVVFDRIREDLAKPRHGLSFMQVLNRAINETLPRTTLTGGTTVLTLVALLIFGGPVIFDFALVLTLGIIIGTFSSIFVASPVLNAIQARWPHKPKRDMAARSTHRSTTAPARA